MASFKQTNVRSIQDYCLETIQTTTNTHSIQAVPRRFALSRIQPTKHNNNYYSNTLHQTYFRPYRQALQHTLHATVLTLLVLLLSHWITQVSVAAAVATSVRYELPTHAPPQSNAYDTQLLSIDVAADDDFNSSAFLTSAISQGTSHGMVSLTAVAASATTSALAAATMHVNATAMLNSNNNHQNSPNNYSISPRYVAAPDSGSSSAALITTSSIWDPSLGAYPTDDGVSIAPPPTVQGTHEEDYDEISLPPWHAAIVCIVLLVIIIGTVIGNVLVCIAVCMVRKLRRPCNYLLVSLALSDLCVALLVMPMAMLYEVLDTWNFGPILCDIWVSFDVLCCTASILNLCAISVDRYLAITKPLEYGVKRTPRRMMACVALVWLAAASISLPPLLILGNKHEDDDGTPICIVCQNFAYQIYATLGSFYIPLSVMLFVYYQIFRAARRIVLEEKRAQTHLQHALNGTASSQPQPQPPVNTDLTVVGSGNGQRHSSYGNTSLTYSTCGTLSAHHPSGGSGGGVSGSTGLLGSPHQKKLRFQLAKEKKASTTLGIIMSAFTICWLPFFILALIRPFVESQTVHIPDALSSLFLWLGYANSLLNPIIYATLNRDFRKPFQLILHLRCSSLNTMMRENYYQDQYGEPPSQRVMLGDERHGARESFL